MRHVRPTRASASLPLVLGILGTTLLTQACGGPAPAGESSPSGDIVAGTFAIAHRGASAYAPEHTEAAYLLAIEQGAAYVEQDLGITKDGVLVCTHDATLERTTDVRERFPDRFREVTVGDDTQRRWFVEDFTLHEIKQLDAGAWFAPEFAGARMLTFQEAIDVVKGKAGFFPELKFPGRFRAAGFDPEGLVAEVLRANDLVGATIDGRPAVHLQVFEEDSVRRLAELLPEVPRSFLIGTDDAAARWLSPEGLSEMRTFATGVAPSRRLVDARPGLVADAHAAGLTVVPYTFSVRGDDATAAGRAALTAQMRTYVDEYEVDGLFTDNPDLFPR